MQVKVLVRKVRNKAAGTIGGSSGPILVCADVALPAVWVAAQSCGQQAVLLVTGDATLDYDRVSGRYNDLSL